MLTSQAVEKTLRDIFPYLKEKFHVSKIGYFGSYARNEQTTFSDIDILVDFYKAPGWDFFTLEEFLEKTFNRRVDLVTRAALKKPLQEEILSQVRYID